MPGNLSPIYETLRHKGQCSPQIPCQLQSVPNCLHFFIPFGIFTYFLLSCDKLTHFNNLFYKAACKYILWGGEQLRTSLFKELEGTIFNSSAWLTLEQHGFELSGSAYTDCFSTNTVNMFSLPYDFLNNLFLPLAYSSVRKQ